MLYLYTITSNYTNMDDSLDNLSFQKQRLKEDKNRSMLLQLKQKFINSLEKMQSPQTRQIAISEIKKLVDHYREQEHLRIYISVLKSLKPNSNSTTKQHQILVVSILAEFFKKNLLDPIDKPPSIVKTSFRLIEILHSYFADKSGTVQQACARALLDITNYVLDGQSEQTIISLVFSPLASILKNGVDKASQGTASVCINQLIQQWTANKQQVFIRSISKQMFTIGMKISSQYHELFIGLYTIIDHIGLQFFENKIAQFLIKFLAILNNNKDNNFNNYMCKVYVCKIVESIAEKISEELKNKLNQLDVIQSLEKASRNRIIQVQMAANRALKVWKGQLSKIQEEDKKRFTSLQEMRNRRKQQKSLSQEKIKLQDNINNMREDLQKMVKGGWGANNRAKNFVKKGSGIGGGYYGGADLSPPQKSSKSHQQHINQLRQYIKKHSNENKQREKFEFYPDRKNQEQHKALSPKKIKQNNQINKNKYTKQKQNDADFQLEIDQGDQSVAPNVRQKYNQLQKPKKVNMQKYASIANEIQPQQIKQLLEHEQSIMRDANDISLDIQSHPQKQKIDERTTKEQKKQKKLQQYYEELIQPVIQETKEKSIKLQEHPTFKKIEKNQTPMWENQPNKNTKNSKKGILSQIEVGQLLQQYNLSQVSSNLNSIVSQNDINMKQSQLKDVDSKIIDASNENIVIREMIQQKNVGKSRNSLMKFMKKSKVSATGEQQNSLNFSESKPSGSKPSPRKQKEQFTLNPQITPIQQYSNKKQAQIKSKMSRFDSFKPIQQANQQQVQEDLVQSYFQDSIPKQQRLRQYQKVAQEVNKMNIQQAYHHQQEQSAQYQTLIRNPPKTIHFSKLSDRRSEIKSTPSYQPPPEQDNQAAVTEQWSKILLLVQTGKINEAYSKIFELDDPIYLLRLMLLTKCPVKLLSVQNSKLLWKKFLDIYKSQFIDVIFVKLFNDANNMKLIKSSMSIEQLQQLLVNLYQISGTSKGKLSFNAATLYNAIDEEVKGKQV